MNTPPQRRGGYTGRPALFMPLFPGGYIYGDTPRQPTTAPHRTPHTPPHRHHGGGDKRVHVYRDTPRNPGTPHTTPRAPRAHDTPHATPAGRGGVTSVCIYTGNKSTPRPTPHAPHHAPNPGGIPMQPGQVTLAWTVPSLCKCRGVYHAPP